MLTFLPKHKHFRGPTAQLTDTAEVTKAKDKLLVLTQFELSPVELKQLQSGIRVKRFSRIAGLSPFIGRGDIIRSNRRTQRLAGISFETKHPIILDSLPCWWNPRWSFVCRNKASM